MCLAYFFLKYWHVDHIRWVSDSFRLSQLFLSQRAPRPSTNGSHALDTTLSFTSVMFMYCSGHFCEIEWNELQKTDGVSNLIPLDPGFLLCVIAWRQNPELKPTNFKQFVFPPSVHLNLHGIGEENEIPPPESPSADYFTGEKLHICIQWCMQHYQSISLTNAPVIPEICCLGRPRYHFMLSRCMSYSRDCVHCKIMYEPFAPHGRYSMLICHKILMLIPDRLLVLHTM